MINSTLTNNRFIRRRRVLSVLVVAVIATLGLIAFAAIWWYLYPDAMTTSALVVSGLCILLITGIPAYLMYLVALEDDCHLCPSCGYAFVNHWPTWMCATCGHLHKGKTSYASECTKCATLPKRVRCPQCAHIAAISTSDDSGPIALYIDPRNPAEMSQVLNTAVGAEAAGGTRRPSSIKATSTERVDTITEMVNALLKASDVSVGDEPPVVESRAEKQSAATSSRTPSAAPIVVNPPPVATPRAVQESWIYNLRSDYQFRKTLARTVSVVTLIAGLIIMPFSLLTGLICIGVGGVLVYLTFSQKIWPIRWFCPQCGKRHHAGLPWRCGHCDHVHNPLVKTDISFLDRCGNPNCRAVPKAFECPFCNAVLFLDGDNDGRHAARKDTAPPMPVHRVDETVRVVRQNELDELEHKMRKLEYDIKFAEMNRTLNPPTPAKNDPRQERMNRMFNSIEDAAIDCKTIEQTFVEEKSVHARIDANPDLNDSQKADVKKMSTMKFDDIRYELSKNVRV